MDGFLIFVFSALERERSIKFFLLKSENSLSKKKYKNHFIMTILLLVKYVTLRGFVGGRL
jgi:hypothetical protein